MKVVYTALFYEEQEGGYSVFIPDFNNISTYGNTLSEAISMSEELIAGVVLDKIEIKEKIPDASKIEDVEFEKLEKYLDIKNWKYKSKFKTYIVVDITEFSKKWGKELVKKTLTIPRWLNTKAEQLNVNFSRVLTEALIEKVSKG
jgi:predicted RNase H-like HicB family nuclease